MTKVPPIQIAPLFTVITGTVLTVTVLTAVLELMQPTELVPVTEYEVVVAGVTVAVPFEKV